jgi:hypothetical protein
MKKASSTNHRVAVWQIGLSLVTGAALAAGLWVVSAPLASAVEKTPAELIQSQLPKDMTIASASDTQLLDAVCKSIRRSPKDVGLIVRTAAGARQSLRGDILCMSIRCANESHSADNKGGPDCAWTLDLVRDWIKQDPNIANGLIESVSQCAPDCRDTLQNLALGEGNFANPPANINAPPGSAGGGAGGDVCQVCHNGANIQIACSDVQGYIAGHPGDLAGACQATPVVNP